MPLLPKNDTGALSGAAEHQLTSQPLMNSHGWKNYWGAGDGSSLSSTSRAVWRLRILFVFVLVAVALFLSLLVFYVLTNSEENLAEAQFASIAQRALVEAQDTVDRQRWAGVTMGMTLSEMYPNASQWPLVEFPGYERLARGLLNTSFGEDMGFAVHVTPEDLPEFEDFAYQVYDKLGFPNGTGCSNFGKGAWGQNASLEHPNNRYHDVTGNTTYQSPYRILTPIFRLDEGPHPLLMFNPHSGVFQGNAIDRMLHCAYQHQTEAEGSEIDQTRRSLSSGELNKCGSITDLFPPAKYGGQRWGVIMYLPVYPANDALTIVGQITPVMLMDRLLENVFADEVSGIDAVFKTATTSVTYRVDNGAASIVGEGDYHDTKYDKYSECVELLNKSLYAEGSPNLRLTLTPNDDFNAAYETNNPMLATVGTICAIVLTSIAFFLYDCFVRREFNAKQELLEARRTFMRFVSHEVRTPLNAVYMGLDLMQSDLAKALGFESTTSLRAAHDFHFSERQQNGDTNTTEKTTSQPKEVLPTTGTTMNGNWLTRQKALDWFQLAHEIQGNTQGAVDILNDLLNYDKIEQGTLHLELEVLSMWDLIEISILEFKLSASSKQIHLSVSFAVPSAANDEESGVVARACELPDKLRKLKVIGDSVRLTQVLRNLMSNALKFTPAMGSVKVKVACVQEDSEKYGTQEEISLTRDKVVNATSRGCIEILVEDTGAGMSPDQVDNVFLDGVQFNVNELQAGNGSGLGLFIAKGLVHQHNGNLSASSDGLDLGSTFAMVLPIWELPETVDIKDLPTKKKPQDGNLERGSCSSNSITATNTSLRVLVVDDVSSNRKLLRRILENAGHQCDDADNGQKAVDMVKLGAASNSPYNAVLMDYEMPVMNGPSAAKEIRQLGFDVSIVGITGNVLPDDIAYFKSCGANDVLPKPIKMAALDASWMDHGVYDQLSHDEV